MKKVLFLGALIVVGLFTSTAFAVAIDDNITPQNCDRSNPACAQFMDTTSVGQIKWGGFIAGGLRSLTNLFVDGKLGVGTLRPSVGEKVLKVDVEGAVGAQFYCDANGNHCVAGDSLGGGDGGSISLTTQGGGLIFSPTTITNTGVISLDTTFVQKRIGGICSGAQAIKQINQDGTVVCQSVGGSVNPVSLTGSNGIVVSPSPITSTGNISIDSTKIQSRITGTCPVNNAIRTIAPDGTVVCQSVGSNGNAISITAGSGILVTPSPITGTGSVSIDPTKTQKRVVGFCPLGESIQKIHEDGSVLCEKTTSTVTDKGFWTAIGNNIFNSNSGNVGVGTQNAVGKLHVLANDNNVITAETTGQFAYLNLKDKNGTAEISNNGGVLVLGGNAASPIVFRNNKYLTRMTITANGNVGIGIDNPTSLFEVKQSSVEAAKNNQYVAKFTDAFGQSSFIGINGNGAEFSGNQGIYAVSPTAKDGIGISGHALAINGETYGGRFVAYKTGTYSKGSIGIYATDLAHTDPARYSGRRDNKIPQELLSSPKEYAGYFDGDVNINGKLNVNGDITINNKPISQSKECAVCISAYDHESNTWSSWKCSGANGAESEATGFTGSKSIEKVKVKMQCI